MQSLPQAFMQKKGHVNDTEYILVGVCCLRAAQREVHSTGDNCRPTRTLICRCVITDFEGGAREVCKNSDFHIICAAQRHHSGFN